jgi:threonine efflux protein
MSLPLLAAACAGSAYTLTPGPAFLALLGIGAGQGRRAGASFLIGHFVGDVVWATLALVAIVGAHAVGALFFDVLGLVCGGYLLWLGARAIAVRRGGAAPATSARRPLLRGLAFGLTNPKGYPVAIAMFTALLAGSGALTWTSVPSLVAAACAGFAIADAVLVLVIGAAVVRRFYRRHELWVVRASGAVFIGFAVHAIVNAVPGLLPKRT